MHLTNSLKVVTENSAETVQYSIVQYSTVQKQYSTVQYSTVQKHYRSASAGQGKA